jgi:hypothetical protein
MTKKHFIALADAIREHDNQAQRIARESQMSQFPQEADAFSKDQLDALADFCQSQNPRFNRDRWLGYIAGTNGKNGGAIKHMKGESLAA